MFYCRAAQFLFLKSSKNLASAIVFEERSGYRKEVMGNDLGARS